MESEKIEDGHSHRNVTRSPHQRPGKCSGAIIGVFCGRYSPAGGLHRSGFVAVARAECVARVVWISAWECSARVCMRCHWLNELRV